MDKKAEPEFKEGKIINRDIEEEMKTALSGYLEVLMDQNPESVGGTLPGDDFYYIEEED